MAPTPTELKKVDLNALKEANLPIFYIVGDADKRQKYDKIVAECGLIYLYSGDILHNEIKSGSARGKKLAKLMDAGELVSMDVILDLIKEAMMKSVGNGTKGLLIDGQPCEVKKDDDLFELEIDPRERVGTLTMEVGSKKDLGTVNYTITNDSRLYELHVEKGKVALEFSKQHAYLVSSLK